MCVCIVCVCITSCVCMMCVGIKCVGMMCVGIKCVGIMYMRAKGKAPTPAPSPAIWAFRSKGGSRSTTLVPFKVWALARSAPSLFSTCIGEGRARQGFMGGNGEEGVEGDGRKNWSVRVFQLKPRCVFSWRDSLLLVVCRGIERMGGVHQWKGADIYGCAWFILCTLAIVLQGGVES